MKKIARRLISGISAAALLVSAVGTDAFISTSENAMRASADTTSGKIGRYTNFGDPEKDTDSSTGDKIYNTNYGLHTDKTAYAAADTDDGRTFDVDLESWYVGENPVDVATILDASGSMAWTVDTLEPLAVNAQLTADEKNILTSKYGKYDLSEIQEDYGGYLPQDVVDLILDKTKTDDSKLSYAGYKYYVYEDRSTVSEFVPLGYWDGGAPSGALKPIGYYPFDGSLENKAKDGASAKYIKQQSAGNSFAETAPDPVEVTPNYSNGNKGIALKTTAQNGAILLDVRPEQGFTISFDLADKYFESSDSYDESPIIFIGNKDNYYRIARGNTGNRGRLRLKHNNSTTDITNDNNKNVLNNNKKITYYNYSYTFNSDSVEIKTDNPKGNNFATTYTDNYTSLDYSKDVYIIIAGNGTTNSNFSENYIKNVVVKDASNNVIGKYSFDPDDSDRLKNTAAGAAADASAYLIEQFTDPADINTAPKTSSPSPKYVDNALNLTQTAKNGAVLLDAKPENDSRFTLSFKVKKSVNDTASTDANIMYIGGMDSSDNYYRIYRDGSSTNRLKMSKKDGNNNYVNINNIFANGEDYSVITVVVEGDKVTQYVNGTKDEETHADLDPITSSYINEKELSLILGGLWGDSYSGSDIYLDELYVFDEALNEEQVKLVSAGKLSKEPTQEDDCKLYHATSKTTGKDIAQIKKTLAQNPNDDEREGWYYVNSHSTWADVEGCLESGKQYIGIYDKDGTNGIEHVAQAGKDIATIPSAYKTNSDYATIKKSIEDGDTDTKEGSTKKFNKAPENERSIRFYVDSQNHLRCFAWSGSTSEEGDIRTFCSLVYLKKDEQKTKYEELNSALNTFYQRIAEKSDLSNNAVVRFSTNSAVMQIKDNDKDTEKKEKNKTTNTNLQKLIMENWTNWSDYYQEVKKTGGTPDTAKYLHDLLIPAEGETSVPADGGTEYPYVMTGGTYTWTGLKAFYDNMVDKEAGDTAKNIANDARDKYLIIFTDGRDNTQDYDVSVEDEDSPAGSPIYTDKGTFGGTKYVNDYNPYKGTAHKVGFSIEYYEHSDNKVPQFKTGVRDIEKDGDLAQAWADKLKEEGYTIYCVMMATGSISPSANADEYNKAKNFLKSLSGGEKVDEEIAELQNEMDGFSVGTKPEDYAKIQNEIEALKDSYVIVVDPSKKEGGGMTVTQAFEQILNEIQLPRNDYNVQDYIDPRFDLVGKDPTDETGENKITYHLGADGKINVTDKDGEPVTSLKLSNGTAFTSGRAVGNIIENAGETGLAYIPMECEMVNRKATTDTDIYPDGYNNGDGIGTGYIYYDNVKDMYYLRWENQTIPMADESFNTYKKDNTLNTDSSGKAPYLDVWSATIRLKAKDDFIGGNNILTNGNEAGENLVYSDATIENMDNNPRLYFSEDELEKDNSKPSGYEDVPLRKKLEALSGTNRKINAVDAGGVSQAVYGDGIDIPSSGFPRTTVNVRLLQLDAKDLNDVIYMGEVISPTMMLADLEDNYMTGSYYLQYLERYAYRLYGNDAGKKPLIELLNDWLKIYREDEEEKTFTVPYIYLPDPEYNEDGTLKKVEGTDKVQLSNNTGWDSEKREAKDTAGNPTPKFDDLNLRDVTGFITYSWIRSDGQEEPQQKNTEGKTDITIDYVVKNTNQIKYNLQLKFTPLKEGALPEGFKLDEYFILPDSEGKGGEQFFKIDETTHEFETIESSAFNDDKKWTTNFGRTDYLQAMISETHTYEPHVMYDKAASNGEGVAPGKWVLVENGDDGLIPEEVINSYVTADLSGQTSSKEEKDSSDNVTKRTLTDKGVYDWDTGYKHAAGDEQIVTDKLNDYYTVTPKNVKYYNVKGQEITTSDGNIITADSSGKYFNEKHEEIEATDLTPVSLSANTTYTKDVVNGALALELVVDGKYLQSNSEINPSTGAKTYTFDAVRYYDDPIDPAPYDTDTPLNADTSDAGKNYKLTFTVGEIPDNPQPDQLYKVWAKLTKVEVEKTSGTSTDYISIKSATTEDTDNHYIGYAEEDALPIGTYVIETNSGMDESSNNSLKNKQFKIGTKPATAGVTETLYFEHLKIDNATASYTYDKFPDSVYNVSKDAADDTKDGEYLINNDTDNSAKNIAKSSRVKTTDTQTLTFRFGTVDKKVKDASGTTTIKNTKGTGVKEKTGTEFNDYAKDRLGIILLSASPNSLAISKEVTNYKTPTDSELSAFWDFTVTFTPDAGNKEDFDEGNKTGFDLKWYKFESDEWKSKTVGDMDTDYPDSADPTKVGAYPEKITFTGPDGDGKYTATIHLKHNEKVEIDGLPEGTWQVTESTGDVFCTPHNDQNGIGGDEWKYVKNNETDILYVNPGSEVQFINELPYELPSAGGSGTYKYILIGGILTAGSVLFFVIQRQERRKRGKVSA